LVLKLQGGDKEGILEAFEYEELYQLVSNSISHENTNTIKPFMATPIVSSGESSSSRELDMGKSLVKRCVCVCVNLSEHILFSS
jgi:hypothetical protein